MAGKFLLDTNIVIALFASEEAVTTRLGQDVEVFLAATVVGELYYGARKSTRMQENTARVAELSAKTPVLACDGTTAFQYGLIKESLRAKGQPIPDNDIWIAALAIQHQLVLASRDIHFKSVDGLPLETW